MVAVLRKDIKETLLPIPDFQSLMLPLLEHVGDGAECTIAGSRDILADRYNLSEEERSQRLPSGAANTFYNRLAWAKTYLERAGLLIKVKRGVFKISTTGIALLRNPPERIDINYLQRFDAFNEFRKKTSETNTDNIEPSLPKENEATPEEALDLAYKDLRDDLATQLLAQIKSSHPSFFEKLVVDLMLKMGYGGPGDDAGTVTSYGHDAGIDGLINEDTLGLDVIYLQAKRWDNTVGRPEIQKFVGALHGKRAKKGVFLTTSSFSAEAIEYASAIDSKVVLIDGLKLSQLLIDFDVGVSTVQAYTIKRIDTDYFEAE
ncbi:MAG: restriction endonuclease [Pirellula sp.]